MKHKIAIVTGLAATFTMLLFTGSLHGEPVADQSVTNAGPSRVIVSDISVFDGMTEAEIIAWLHAPAGGNMTADTKPPVQVIVIEAYDDPDRETTEAIKIPAQFLEAAEPQPEWYEWVDPRLFLEQWAEWWTSETNAPPVVLILIRF